jgi:outer membrane protein assembly factor BamE (lipoprotein component of BamABCDE complex)
MKPVVTIVFLAGTVFSIATVLANAQSSPSSALWKQENVHQLTHKHHRSPSFHHESTSSNGGRELSFEVIRMLSTGMSKAQVLSIAGAPQYKSQRSRSTTWVYSSTDRWIVELSFDGERVKAINWTRP